MLLCCSDVIQKSAVGARLVKEGRRANEFLPTYIHT